ncbi:hypothetical protein [Actinokineospora inagensis]|uniref:hypothetical protein n=1 Tax=Actinokineospora inagensis TaxID=103730 RepID=UPI000478D611|nr:hypothetical protein [Actinokineospora inagensis]
MDIQRVNILRGHTSPDTAYLVDDYPYGRTLRCQIRYWVENGKRGKHRRLQRFMSQTTDPQRDYLYWNNPKASTYTELVVMFLNSEEHVRSFHVSEHITPVADARFRLMGLYDQLDEGTRARYDLLLRRAQGYLAPWDRFEATLTALASHITRHGTAPLFDGPVWTDDTGQRHHVGESPVVYLMLAHQRAEETP